MARRTTRRAGDRTAPLFTEGGGPDWRALFARRSPEEVLAHLVEHDELGLRARVAARLRDEVWMLDADRVHLRALARCAREAPRYRGAPALATWLDGHVEAAVIDLLEEDADAAAGVIELEPEDDAALDALARPLGLGREGARAVCAAFNARPADERRAFRALLLDGGGETAHERETDAVEAARLARRALDAVMAADAGSSGGREADDD